MKNLNIYSNSGASTNLEFLAGVAHTVMGNGYRPNIVDGNSSGALIAPLIAMNRMEDLKHLALTYTVDSAFSLPPLKENQSPSLHNLYRLGVGENSLGKMDNLFCTLMDAFTEQDYWHWVNNKLMPDMFIATVDYKTGKLHRWNLRKVRNYTKAIKCIVASASIPLMAEYVEIDGGWHYDGGARTHTLAPYMQDKYYNKIKRHISVYSRPFDFSIPKPDLKSNIPSIAKRTLDIMVMELSKGNQRAEVKNRTKLKLSVDDMLFAPKLLKKNTYEFGNNAEKFEIGVKQGELIII